MSFSRNRGFWIVFCITAPPFLIFCYYEIKAMNSVYKKDMGLGLVIYADDYVNSGHWVFDCRYGRLISRKPIGVPMADLEAVEKFEFGKVYMKKEDIQPAKEALNAVRSNSDWYKELRYRYSGLSEWGDLRYHSFDLIAQHQGRAWALDVFNSIYRREFTITVKPYNPETHVDYARALKEALTSCPVLQSAQQAIPG
ncbi:MAG: hypothetical protein ACOH2R_06980 [Pseudomonas sp.]